MFGFIFRLAWRVAGFATKVVMFVAALAVVAGGTMYALFDGEQFKRELSQRVVDVTGRALAIDGAAELQMTLPPRLVLNNVRIPNPRGGRDMARIRRVEIDLNPLSAITRESSLAQMRLDGADIVLDTAQAGESSWQNFAIGAAGQAVVASLGFGLFTPPVGVPPVVLSNTTITILGPGAPGGSGGSGGITGPTAGVQTISLGATTLQVAGSAAPPVYMAPLLAAAVNPCETEEPQRSTAQQPSRAGAR